MTKQIHPKRSLFRPARALVVAAALAGCGGDDASTQAPTDAAADRASDAAADVAVDRAAARPPVRLLVDADRNGVVEDVASDWDHRADWDATHGASLLANVDDDDVDNAVDALDDVVNGEADEADLARVRVAAWADAPDGAEGSLAVDEGSATRVRLFRHNADGWAVFDPTTDRVADAELRAGVEFGIEARDFATRDWDGHVELTLTVTAGAQTLTDRARMRTAPWLEHNSLSPTIGIYGPRADDYLAARRFTADLDDHATADMMPLTLVNTEDPAYTSPMMGPDVWVQDFMDFGWTGIPGPDGLHAMQIVMRTATPDRKVGLYAPREVLGPDMGYTWHHTTAAENGGAAYDPSLNSFGDLELLPPHSNNGHDYPLGRIIHGSIPTRHSDVAYRGFLDAQVVQGPVLYVDTSFLLVGHIDELISFVPADTPRGWRLLIASPRLARTMLQEFVSRGAANADALIFRNKRWFYADGPMMGQSYSAERTVGSVLADADLMSANASTQAHIEILRMRLQEEVGLTDDEITEVPFLFWAQERGRVAAYQPGTVNLLYFNHTAIMARPHGPTDADGHDIFETDMTQRLGTLGVNVQFAEQWDLLHAADGEVHCGTNALREVPSLPWWGVAR